VTTRTTHGREAYRGLPNPSRTIPFAIALAAAALLAVAPRIQAAESPLTSTAIGGLTLPEYIGPLEFIGEHTGPEAGRSLTYSYRAVGLALELSITDLGAGGVEDGIDGPELLERYGEAEQDVIAATKVRGLRPKHEKTVSLSDARVAREVLFTTRKKRDTGGSTYLIFTAAHGLVIDARFDIAPGFEEDGALSHGEILAALGQAIPATTAATVEARARAAAEAAVASQVTIMWDPATPVEENRIWLAYLFARAAYAVRENTGEPVAGERDASFEEEVRGRSVALSTFRDLRHNDARLASAYFSDIDRVEAAGFLREYVWSYLHHASWAAPPADLKLAAFEAWRGDHLIDHVPVTHGRIAFRLSATSLPTTR
jgi:hypothetical protein